MNCIDCHAKIDGWDRTMYRLCTPCMGARDLDGVQLNDVPRRLTDRSESNGAINLLITAHDLCKTMADRLHILHDVISTNPANVSEAARLAQREMMALEAALHSLRAPVLDLIADRVTA